MKLTCVAVTLAASAHVANAQEIPPQHGNWPQHNVRFQVAFAPAGPADIVARLLGQALQAKWGQTIIIENRAGAGGNTGAVNVARAEPDGYTILVSTSAFSVNLNLYDKPGYALSDFQVATIASTSPNILVAAPNLKQNTLKEIIEASKTTNLAFASAGVGTTPHLTGELIFRLLAKVDIRHVPFTGAGPAVNAAMAGQVPLALVALPGAIEQVKGNTVKGIAIATAKRIADLPDVPTMIESGIDVEAASIVAFFMPAKTPPAIVAKFNADVNDVIRSGALDKAFAAAGVSPLTYTPAQSQAFIIEETRKWGEVIKASGLKAE